MEVEHLELLLRCHKTLWASVLLKRPCGWRLFIFCMQISVTATRGLLVFVFHGIDFLFKVFTSTMYLPPQHSETSSTVWNNFFSCPANIQLFIYSSSKNLVLPVFGMLQRSFRNQQIHCRFYFLLNNWKNNSLMPIKAVDPSTHWV